MTGKKIKHKVLLITAVVILSQFFVSLLLVDKVYAYDVPEDAEWIDSYTIIYGDTTFFDKNPFDNDRSYEAKDGGSLCGKIVPRDTDNFTAATVYSEYRDGSGNCQKPNGDNQPTNPAINDNGSNGGIADDIEDDGHHTYGINVVGEDGNITAYQIDPDTIYMPRFKRHYTDFGSLGDREEADGVFKHLPDDVPGASEDLFVETSQNFVSIDEEKTIEWINKSESKQRYKICDNLTAGDLLTGEGLFDGCVDNSVDIVIADKLPDDRAGYDYPEPGSGLSDSDDGEDNAPTCASESGSSFGWVLCPIINHAVAFLDWIFANTVEPVLQIDLGEEENQSDLRQVWNGFRIIANLLFVIAFFVVIYSAASGNLLSAYDVRKLLPRLFIIAILVQLSYFLSILALDISNEVGASVQGLFNIVTGDESAIRIDFGPELDIKDNLAGTIRSVADPAAGVAAGAATGLAVIVVLVIAMVYSVMGVVLLIGVFMVRAIGIISLIAISPIAFSLALLPGTEGFFRSWWKWYFGLLVMYPIMMLFLMSGLLVGRIIQASQVFSLPFLNNLAALIVIFLPFFVAPRVLQFAGAATGALNGALKFFQEKGQQIGGKEGIVRGSKTYKKTKGRAYSGAARYGDTTSGKRSRRLVGRVMGSRSISRRAAEGVQTSEGFDAEDAKAAGILLGQKTAGMSQEKEQEYLREVSSSDSSSAGLKRAAMQRMLINKDVNGLEMAFRESEKTASGSRMLDRFKADNADALNTTARHLLIGQDRTVKVQDAAGNVTQRRETREVASARMLAGSTHQQLAPQSPTTVKSALATMSQEVARARARGTAEDDAYANDVQADMNKMLDTYNEIFTKDAYSTLRGQASGNKGTIEDAQFIRYSNDPTSQDHIDAAERLSSYNDKLPEWNGAPDNFENNAPRMYTASFG